MSHQRALHLGRTDPVSTYVQYVVHPASDPDVPILVPLTRVTGEVVSGIRRHVHGEVPLVIAQARPGHSRPRLLDRQHTLDAIPLNLFPGTRIQHNRVDTVEGEGAAPRLHGGHSGEVRHNVPSRLRLPVGIDHGALGIANDLVVPPPRLGVDGFTDRPQYPQTAQVILLGSLVAESHQRSNGRGGGVEHGDLMPLDHVPIPSVIGIHGSRFEHEGRRSVQERSVHDVGMSRDPASVGDARVHVSLFEIKRDCRRLQRVHAVPSRGVDQTLGLTRRSGRVQYEESIFRIHPLAGTVRTLRLDEGIELDVAVVELNILGSGMFEHEHFLNDLGAVPLGDGSVADLLEGKVSAAALTPVGRDYPTGRGGRDTIGDGVSREARKDDRVCRPYAGAREHGHGQLGDHGHIQRDHIPLLHPARLQRVRDLAHLPQALLERNLSDIVRLVPLPENRHLLAPVPGGSIPLAVPVEGVVARVDLTVEEPSDVSLDERSFADGRVRREPVELALRKVGPVGRHVRDGFLVLLLQTTRYERPPSMWMENMGKEVSINYAFRLI
mmetsp:Transcript_5942/g.17136  ORF Transcript_5942/g.17136 Transcript_5942/m.17136 type:complete len:553 (-) Transcript_5942:441-2099(-)